MAIVLVVALHVGAGLVSVVSGIVAMLSRKGGRVHVVAGRVYVGGITGLFATMIVLAATRWPHDNHLAVLGVIALGATLLGLLNRRRHGADRWHILAMGVSYVVMLTAFYVDNGPTLPLWSLLPPWSFWFIPSLVGAPLFARGIFRRSRPRSRSASGAG